MEFKRAHICNFKLLEDIKVDFSVERERPLTVIRAENASGKTSLLTALQWGLYGEQALEDRAIPLSASHWPEGTICPVSTELFFRHTVNSDVGGVKTERTRDYRLIRSVTEVVKGGKPQRANEKLSLIESTEHGWEEVKFPGQQVEQILSADLRDIFFTNGDAAMNFISPKVTRLDKRSQVREAIKALLELGIIEDAVNHVRNVRTTKRRESTSAGGDVATLAGQVEGLTTRIKELEQKRGELSSAVAELTTRYEGADRTLQEVLLQLGNHDVLAKHLRDVNQQLHDSSEMLGKLRREHQGLFGSRALSWSLMDSALRAGASVLNSLHDSGIIPKTAIPVLRDRLDLERCICGASLSPGTAARKAVEDEIANQRSADSVQQRLTRMYHQADFEINERIAGQFAWDSQVRTVVADRTKLDKKLRELKSEESSIRVQISAIDHADVEEKRRNRQSIESALTEKRDLLQQIEFSLTDNRNRLLEASKKYDEMRKQDERLRRVNAHLTATQDALTVFELVVEQLQGPYLQRVSTRMNELFLRMIAADDELPEAMRVITGASITSEFDILVHAGNRTLNPDHELNGASQRALTFAFIWALTEVSETVAPRIIDTPLGMMSGYVKRTVLDLISAPVKVGEPDRQVILFLTRSEIAQVEKLLDARAGLVFTMTNTSAGDLLNRDDAVHPRIIRCECNHRQVCRICSRQDDAAYGLVAGWQEVNR